MYMYTTSPHAYHDSQQFWVDGSSHLSARPLQVSVDQYAPVHPHLTVLHALLFLPQRRMLLTVHLLVPEKDTLLPPGTHVVKIGRAASTAASHCGSKLITGITTL